MGWGRPLLAETEQFRPASQNTSLTEVAGRAAELIEAVLVGRGDAVDVVVAQKLRQREVPGAGRTMAAELVDVAV